SAEVKSGRKKLLSYSGVMVEVINGVVPKIPEGFENTCAEAKKKQTEEQSKVEEYQKQGLVFYDGKWVTPEKRDHMQVAGQHARARKSKAQTQNSDILTKTFRKGMKIYKSNGKEVNHSYLLSKRNITVIIFHSEYPYYAAKSRFALGRLRAEANKHSNIVVKSVDLSDSTHSPLSSSTAKTYNIAQVPEIRVFDDDGQLIGNPTSDMPTALQYIAYALRTR
ncbi:MAG TPA: hypothetical protein VIR63_01035, partial [Pontiella sp.]